MKIDREQFISESVEPESTTVFPYRDEMKVVYQQAFAGYPWHEDLSDEEVYRRLDSQVSKPGFEGIWLLDQKDGSVVGATWFDRPSLGDLERERGSVLRKFAETQINNLGGDVELIWQRETLTTPKDQGKGIGRYLKELVKDCFEQRSLENGRPILVLTRMRGDNYGIIRINKELGMQESGILIPSSQVEGLFHQYWYQVYQSS